MTQVDIQRQAATQVLHQLRTQLGREPSHQEMVDAFITAGLGVDLAAQMADQFSGQLGNQGGLDSFNFDVGVRPSELATQTGEIFTWNVSDAAKQRLIDLGIVIPGQFREDEGRPQIPMSIGANAIDTLRNSPSFISQSQNPTGGASNVTMEGFDPYLEVGIVNGTIMPMGEMTDRFGFTFPDTGQFDPGDDDVLGDIDPEDDVSGSVVTFSNGQTYPMHIWNTLSDADKREITRTNGGTATLPNGSTLTVPTGGGGDPGGTGTGGGTGGTGQVGVLTAADLVGKPPQDVADAFLAGFLSQAEAFKALAALGWSENSAKFFLGISGGVDADNGIPTPDPIPTTPPTDVISGLFNNLTPNEQLQRFIQESFPGGLSNPAIQRGLGSFLDILPTAFAVQNPQGTQGQGAFDQFIKDAMTPESLMGIGNALGMPNQSPINAASIGQSLRSLMGSDANDPNNLGLQFLESPGASTMMGRFGNAIDAASLPRHLTLSPFFRGAASRQADQFAQGQFLSRPEDFKNVQDVLRMFAESGFF